MIDKLKTFSVLFIVFLGIIFGLIACGQLSETSPATSNFEIEAASLGIDEQLAKLLAQAGVTQFHPGPKQDPAKVELGRFLMYDKILSGNKDISCATCHHSTLWTGDAIPLSIGTGGKGLGPDRQLGKGRGYIPRHAPEVFNRGAPGWRTMFWDSKVAFNLRLGFITPAGDKLPKGLDNVVAAQAMFPVTSRSEMRGNKGDVVVNGNNEELNEIALIKDGNFTEIWAALTKRVVDIPEYKRMFKEVYPSVPTREIGFQHIANSIAAFEIDAWTFTQSPWDRYLRGQKDALTLQEKRGAVLFYGEAKCSECHSGNLMTNQEHHNAGIPQLGPGKGASAPLDMGFYLRTGKWKHRFAFRTPPLRNVELTAPYMHNGAHATLEEVVRHYSDVEFAIRNYDPNHLPPDLEQMIHNDRTTINKVLNTLDPIVAEPLNLTDRQIGDLVAFLEALTDPAAIDMSHIVPNSVPSGLPIKD